MERYSSKTVLSISEHRHCMYTSPKLYNRYIDNINDVAFDIKVGGQVGSNRDFTVGTKATVYCSFTTIISRVFIQ